MPAVRAASFRPIRTLPRTRARRQPCLGRRLPEDSILPETHVAAPHRPRRSSWRSGSHRNPGISHASPPLLRLPRAPTTNPGRGAPGPQASPNSSHAASTVRSSGYNLTLGTPTTSSRAQRLGARCAVMRGHHKCRATRPLGSGRRLRVPYLGFSGRRRPLPMLRHRPRAVSCRETGIRDRRGTKC